MLGTWLNKTISDNVGIIELEPNVFFHINIIDSGIVTTLLLFCSTNLSDGLLLQALAGVHASSTDPNISKELQTLCLHSLVT